MHCPVPTNRVDATGYAVRVSTHACQRLSGAETDAGLAAHVVARQQQPCSRAHLPWEPVLGGGGGRCTRGGHRHGCIHATALQSQVTAATQAAATQATAAAKEAAAARAAMVAAAVSAAAMVAAAVAAAVTAGAAAVAAADAAAAVRCYALHCRTAACHGMLVRLHSDITTMHALHALLACVVE